jgi:rubrerythrin
MNIREAIELAIEAETKAKERYLELSQIAEDQETRLMLEQIAKEEESHYKRLVERLKAIKLMGK